MSGRLIGTDGNGGQYQGSNGLAGSVSIGFGPAGLGRIGGARTGGGTKPSTSVRQQVGMGSVFADVIGGHPRFLVRVVQCVPVQRDIRRDDESVRVIGCYRHLHLGRRHGRLVDDYSHLLSVSNGLTALRGPDQETFVRIDV